MMIGRIVDAQFCEPAACITTLFNGSGACVSMLERPARAGPDSVFAPDESLLDARDAALPAGAESVAECNRAAPAAGFSSAPVGSRL
jgi:hypothetical protein